MASDHTIDADLVAELLPFFIDDVIERLGTVEEMVALGAAPERIQVLLGPAAAGESYEVPAEMAADVEKHLPGSRTTTKQGTAGIDVRAGLVHQLMSMGVTHIDADPRDTITDTDFFSHRREGVTGRQAGVIWMPDA